MGEINVSGNITANAVSIGDHSTAISSGGSQEAALATALLAAIDAHRGSLPASVAAQEEQLRAATASPTPDRSRLRTAARTIAAMAPGVTAVAKAANDLLHMVQG